MWEATDADEKRWQKEAEFFDNEEYEEGPLPESVIQRYLNPQKPWLPAEFPFWVIGNVNGLTILEVGCGDGGNAIILGRKGAHVVGIDISPRAIEVARKRAALHGLGDRVRFECTPLEIFVQNNATARFDIIAGWAVLHHLLPVLDSFLVNLNKLADENTRFLFVEPVSLWRWLRRIRLMLPIQVHGTPDERPLHGGDLAIIEGHVAGLQKRYFDVFTRIVGRIASALASQQLMKKPYLWAARCDRILLSIPGASGMAGLMVMYSHSLLSRPRPPVASAAETPQV